MRMLGVNARQWGGIYWGLLGLAMLPLSHACAMDYVSIRRGEKAIHLSGKIEVEAQNGGLLFRSRDGVLWMVQPEEIKTRESDETPFKPLSQAEVSMKLLGDLPVGFRVHRTLHYVFCYNTSEAYAQWCGALYERLYRGFYDYWSNLGVRLDEPETPLVALVFDSKTSISSYARQELGAEIGPIIGYYNMETNRVNMYDLTGVEGQGSKATGSTADQINRILRQPRAEANVATIVHEATHQLAYNSSLQVRYADNPFWVSEGLAVFFETPDLKSSKGWRGIGSLNRARLLQFRRYLRTRPSDSLITLLSDDKRFRDPKRALDTYAEAWALNYFLFKTLKRRDYVRYLKMLSEKKPLIAPGAETRVAEFKAIFGSDLEAFDRQFLTFMRKLR